MGCKPILPPDLEVKISAILRGCDHQILNQKEDDIKTEIEKQNDRVEVQDIFKYNSSNNIKVTFDSQYLASLALTRGLLLFDLSHPAHNISIEIFVKILICFKCYQLEDHCTSSCPKFKDYKIYSLCASPWIHFHAAFGSVLTCEDEDSDHR